MPRACYRSRMKSLPFLAILLSAATSVFAADLGELIFQDDFNRN
jgi:hypothetical protein